MLLFEQPTKESIITTLEKLKTSKKFKAIVQSIQPGKVERDMKDPEYMMRVAYTMELRRFVYNPQYMNIILTDKKLKRLFFRTFGYKGNLDFTIYPICWIRDLPLLSIGKKCYLGDGILLGTNRVNPTQSHLSVDHISIGARTVFDQQCAVGPGTEIGTDCNIGFRSGISAKTIIGNQVKISEIVNIGSRVEIGNNVHICQGSHISDFVTIEAQAEIDYNTFIPPEHIYTKEGKLIKKE